MPLWQLGNYGESLQDIKDYILTDGIWNVSHQPDETIDAPVADASSPRAATSASPPSRRSTST